MMVNTIDNLDKMDTITILKCKLFSYPILLQKPLPDVLKMKACFCAPIAAIVKFQSSSTLGGIW